jgi:hypothetical protein
VGGARGAQLTDRAATIADEEDLVLLAAEKPSLADVARYVGLGGDD